MSRTLSSPIVNAYGLERGWRCRMCNEHQGNAVKMAQDHEYEVLQAIAKDNGGPDFSARVFDDEAVARTYLSDKSDPPLDADVRRAHNAQEEQHLIAGYLGGIDAYSAQPSTAASAYNISWFPAAFTSNPNVGQYVKLNDQWKP
jgi:hypothetical protein